MHKLKIVIETLKEKCYASYKKTRSKVEGLIIIGSLYTLLALTLYATTAYREAQSVDRSR